MVREASKITISLRIRPSGDSVSEEVMADTVETDVGTISTADEEERKKKKAEETAAAVNRDSSVKYLFKASNQGATQGHTVKGSKGVQGGAYVPGSVGAPKPTGTEGPMSLAEAAAAAKKKKDEQ